MAACNRYGPGRPARSARSTRASIRRSSRDPTAAPPGPRDRGPDGSTRKISPSSFVTDLGPLARFLPGAEVTHGLGLLRRPPGLAPQPAKRLVPGHADTPRTRSCRYPVGGPLDKRRGACLLHRVLDHLQVTHEADDRRHRRPPVEAEHIAVLAAQLGASTGTTGRTSTDPSAAAGMVAAHVSGSSRSAHSTSVQPPNCSLISAAGPHLRARICGLTRRPRGWRPTGGFERANIREWTGRQHRNLYSRCGKKPRQRIAAVPRAERTRRAWHHGHQLDQGGPNGLRHPGDPSSRTPRGG